MAAIGATGTMTVVVEATTEADVAIMTVAMAGATTVNQQLQKSGALSAAFFMPGF